MDVMPEKHHSFVIFTVGNGTGAEVTNFVLWAALEGVPVKMLQGCWDGKRENSVIVPAEYLDKVRHPWTDGQDAIIVLGEVDQRTGKRPVAVEYGGENGHWHHGGHSGSMWWTEISAAEAKTQRGWTYDPRYDTYWLVMNEGGEVVDLTRESRAGQTSRAADIDDNRGGPDDSAYRRDMINAGRGHLLR